MAERPPIAVTPLSAAAVVQRVVAEQAAVMRRQARPVRRGRDAEAVHRMRVATRRLRAVLRVFRHQVSVPDRLARRLAWIARRLGAVRDRDVLLQLLASHHVAAIRGAEADRLDRLLRRLARERRAAQKALVAALERRRWSRLLADLKGFARAPRPRGRREVAAARVMAESADRLAAAVAEHRGMTDPAPDPGALHELRIEFKRLRYVLEVHAASGEVAYGVELRLARAMQDVLGAIHDHDILLDRLARGRGAFRGPWRLLRTRLIRERQVLRRRFLKLREAWAERTGPAPTVAPLEPPRFANLEPQPVTLRLVAGGRQVAARGVGWMRG